MRRGRLLVAASRRRRAPRRRLVDSDLLLEDLALLLQLVLPRREMLDGRLCARELLSRLAVIFVL